MSPLTKPCTIFLLLVFSCSIVKSQDIRLIKDINPGSSSSLFGNLYVYNDLLCFAAKYNGNAGGFYSLTSSDSLTRYLVDAPGYNSAMITPGPVFHDKLILTVNDYLHGSELWQFDGISTPQMVSDINPGNSGSSPENFFIFKDKLYFKANDGVHGEELWAWDGTNAPYMVMDIWPGGDWSEPFPFFEFNEMMIFPAMTANYGTELWCTDGNSVPRLLYDIRPGSESSIDRYTVRFIIYRDKLYFKADDGVTGEELWVCDGIHQPSLVYDINPGGADSHIEGFAIVGDKLCFGADDGQHGTEIWQYDGINPPAMVYDLAPGFYPGVDFFAYNCLFKGKLYFPGRDTTGDYELWAYDGVSMPFKVYDINTNGNSNLYYLHADSNRLYFSANDGIHGQELFEYDGVSNPRMVYDIFAGSKSSGPFAFAFLNNKLYFRAQDSLHGCELWCYAPEILGIDNSVSHDAVVYPNPSRGVFTVDLGYEPHFPVVVQVTDLSGKIVHPPVAFGSNPISLELADLVAGIYLIHVVDRQSIIVKKVILK